jgi:hypothetical protein
MDEMAARILVVSGKTIKVVGDIAMECDFGSCGHGSFSSRWTSCVL